MKMYQLCIISASIFIAGSVTAQELDDRFVPITTLSEELLEQLVQKEVEPYTVEGSLLRDQVAAGTHTVKEWDPKTQSTSLDPDLVRVQDTLEAFAEAVVLQDERIERLSFSESMITILYLSSGKFFGFLPVMVRSTVTIVIPPIDATAAGSVTVETAWYHILTKKSVSQRIVADRFASEVQLLNSEFLPQRIAQFLNSIGKILREL